MPARPCGQNTANRKGFIMQSIKKNSGSLLVCLFEIVVGVLLLIEPVRFTTGIIMAFGVVLALRGLMWMVRYFRSDVAQGAAEQTLSKGLAALVAGGFCLLRSQWFVSAFPVLTMLYGAAVLLVSLGKVQWTIDMLRMRKNRWFLGAISAVVSLICAVIILSNPFASTAVLWIFTAVTLIAEAVFDIVTLLTAGR